MHEIARNGHEPSEPAPQPPPTTVANAGWGLHGKLELKGKSPQSLHSPLKDLHTHVFHILSTKKISMHARARTCKEWRRNSTRIIIDNMGFTTPFEVQVALRQAVRALRKGVGIYTQIDF